MSIKIQKGDRIKFKAPVKYGEVDVIRDVVGFSAAGEPLVDYHGWTDFVVRRREVNAVYAKDGLLVYWREYGQIDERV